MIFPENPARVLVSPASICARARYTNPHRDGGGDYYTVFVKDIHKICVRDEQRKSRIKISRGMSRVLVRPVSLPVSLTVFLVAIACHEVRHRMQFHHRIRYYAWRLLKMEPDDMLKLSARWVRCLFDVLRDDSKRASPEKQRRVKRETNSMEFDAMTIETAVINTLKSDRSLEKVIPILQFGTQEV